MATVKAGRAWYLFSCEHDVIGEEPEQKGNNLHIIQPTLHLTLGLYDISVFSHMSNVEDRKLHLANVG